MSGDSFGFCGQSFTLENPISGIQRTVNFIPEMISDPNQSQRIILNKAPGTRLWATVGTGKFRGGILWNGALYSVLGATVYSTTSGGVSTSLGNVSNVNNSTPVTMVASTTQLMILADGFGYYVQAGVLTPIADVDFPSSVLKGEYSDGYFIVITTRYIFVSGLNDVTSWDPLDFTVVQASTNDLVSTLMLKRRLFVFGTQIVQPFVNTGNPDFPFEADEGGIINFGAAATFGVMRSGDTFLFLQADERGNGTVIDPSGHKVTNHGQDYAFQGYSTISDAITSSFQYRGHNFFQITFPTANTTHRYDVDEGFWHEALYWNTGNGSFEAHLGLFHVFAFKKHLTFARNSGKIYELTGDVYDDNGDPMRALRRCAVRPADGSKVTINSIRPIIQPGVGLNVATTVSGYDPQLIIRVSMDGGKTGLDQSDIADQQSIGRYGEFDAAPEFTRLGSGYAPVIEIEGTDPVPYRFTDCLADIEVAA